jgi:hypothetical protein
MRIRGCSARCGSAPFCAVLSGVDRCRPPPPSAGLSCPAPRRPSSRSGAASALSASGIRPWSTQARGRLALWPGPATATGLTASSRCAAWWAPDMLQSFIRWLGGVLDRLPWLFWPVRAAVRRLLREPAPMRAELLPFERGADPWVAALKGWVEVCNEQFAATLRSPERRRVVDRSGRTKRLRLRRPIRSWRSGPSASRDTGDGLR